MAGKPKPRQTVDVKTIDNRGELPENAHPGEFFIRITPLSAPLSAREQAEVITKVKAVLKEQGHTIARGAAAVQARS